LANGHTSSALGSFFVFYQQGVNEVTKALLSAPKLQFHFQIFQACCKGYTDIYIYVYIHVFFMGVNKKNRGYEVGNDGASEFVNFVSALLGMTIMG
jgi:uncharacterized protein (DUF2164 family)